MGTHMGTHCSLLPMGTHLGATAMVYLLNRCHLGYMEWMNVADAFIEPLTWKLDTLATAHARRRTGPREPPPFPLLRFISSMTEAAAYVLESRAVQAALRQQP